MDTELDDLLKARLQDLEVTDIREDVRKDCFVKLKREKHLEMLQKSKFKFITNKLKETGSKLDVPNCWLVRERLNARTTVEVGILPPPDLRIAAGTENLRIKAEKLRPESIDTVLGQEDAEVNDLSVVVKLLQEKSAAGSEDEVEKGGGKRKAEHVPTLAKRSRTRKKQQVESDEEEEEEEAEVGGEEEEEAEVEGPRCSAGHSMLRRDWDASELMCDGGCGRALRRGAGWWCCEKCDEDVCDACHGK